MGVYTNVMDYYDKINILKQQLQQSQHRERVLREALEEVVNPIHKIHWGLVDPGDPNCHCTVCRNIRSALEERK